MLLWLRVAKRAQQLLSHPSSFQGLSSGCHKASERTDVHSWNTRTRALHHVSCMHVAEEAPMVEVAGDARRLGITYPGSAECEDSAHARRKAWPPATSELLVNRREAELHLNSVGVPHPAHNVTACRIPGTLYEE